MAAAPQWSPVPGATLGNGRTVEAANGAHRIAARLLDVLVLSPAALLIFGAFFYLGFAVLGHGIGSIGQGTSYPGFETPVGVYVSWWLGGLVVMGVLGLSATRRRQWRGWHDSLAGTVVVTKPSAVSLRPDVAGGAARRDARRRHHLGQSR